MGKCHSMENDTPCPLSYNSSIYMKLHSTKILTLLFALVLFFYGCSNDAITSSTPSIRVTQPAPSSVVDAGTTCDIRWDIAGDADNAVGIDLYADTGFVQNIASSVPNSGDFSWRVSSLVPRDTACRIKVSGAARPSVYGFSGVFTIVNNTDGYEPDGTPEAATAIAASGIPQKHRISAPDTDWFKFNAVAGMTYCIQTNGNADTYLRLYDSNATALLTGDDNSGAGSNALIIRTFGGAVSGGTYYFKVTAPFQSIGADYFIDVRSGGAILAITNPTAQTDSLTSGSTLSIAWSYSVNTGNSVSLYAFRDDTLASAITSGIVNNGRYSWSIPWTLPTSSSYRIRIVSNNDTSIHDLSDAFTITCIPTTLTLTTPSSSTVWSSGSVYPVYWTYTGNPGPSVTLALYDSAGLDTAFPGTYSLSSQTCVLAVPLATPSSSSYRLKLTSASDPTLYCFSAPFTITKIPTTLAVTTPAAAANWNTGTTYSISWTYTGNPGNSVTLWLCDSSSAQVLTITNNGSAKTGSYNWAVPPGVATGNYRVKIACTQDTSISGYSGLFGITNIPTAITVTTPDSTTVWNAGSSNTVVWNFIGPVGGAATLSLYNDTTFVQTITASGVMTASPASLAWSLPSSLPGGARYRIKIASNVSPAVAGFSGHFTIVQMPGKLTITTPGASSAWNTGSSYTISWTYAGATGPYVKLDLYDSTSFAGTISTSQPATAGSFVWLVPSSLATGARYRIKITSTTQDTIFNFSGLFTITNVPEVITVLTPAANQILNAKSSVYLNWNSSGPVPGSYVSISLVDTSGTSSVIASSVFRTNSYYLWSIPATQAGGSKLRVRVASTADTTVAGYSSPFTIVPAPPDLNITSPDSTTSWTAGYNYTIYWSYAGAPGAIVRLELYDSTALVQTISQSVYTANGNLLWYVPLFLKTDGRYRVKIASATLDSVSAFSGYFQIVNNSLSDAYEPDSTYSLAKQIIPGAAPQSHSLTGGDKDWLYFSASGGTTYTVQTFGQTDTYLNLFSPDGATIIMSNDDNGADLNAKIVWKCLSSGTYYFEVSSLYGGGGNYTVSVR